MKGEKISPKEIEDVIAKFPGVKQVTVTGISNYKFGEKIKANIVSNKNAKLNKKIILHFCSIHLEENLIPHEVEFKDCA